MSSPLSTDDTNPIYKIPTDQPTITSKPKDLSHHPELDTPLANPQHTKPISEDRLDTERGQKIEGTAEQKLPAQIKEEFERKLLLTKKRATYSTPVRTPSQKKEIELREAASTKVLNDTQFASNEAINTLQQDQTAPKKTFAKPLPIPSKQPKPLPRIPEKNVVQTISSNHLRNSPSDVLDGAKKTTTLTTTIPVLYPVAENRQEDPKKQQIRRITKEIYSYEEVYSKRLEIMLEIKEMMEGSEGAKFRAKLEKLPQKKQDEYREIFENLTNIQPILNKSSEYLKNLRPLKDNYELLQKQINTLDNLIQTSKIEKNRGELIKRKAGLIKQQDAICLQMIKKFSEFKLTDDEIKVIKDQIFAKEQFTLFLKDNGLEESFADLLTKFMENKEPQNIYKSMANDPFISITQTFPRYLLFMEELSKNYYSPDLKAFEEYLKPKIVEINEAVKTGNWSKNENNARKLTKQLEGWDGQSEIFAERPTRKFSVLNTILSIVHFPKKKRPLSPGKAFDEARNTLVMGINTEKERAAEKLQELKKAKNIVEIEKINSDLEEIATTQVEFSQSLHKLNSSSLAQELKRQTSSSEQLRVISPSGTVSFDVAEAMQAEERLQMIREQNEKIIDELYREITSISDPEIQKQTELEILKLEEQITNQEMSTRKKINDIEDRKLHLQINEFSQIQKILSEANNTNANLVLNTDANQLELETKKTSPLPRALSTAQPSAKTALLPKALQKSDLDTAKNSDLGAIRKFLLDSLFTINSPELLKQGRDIIDLIRNNPKLMEDKDFVERLNKGIEKKLNNIDLQELKESLEKIKKENESKISELNAEIESVKESFKPKIEIIEKKHLQAIETFTGEIEALVNQVIQVRTSSAAVSGKAPSDADIIRFNKEKESLKQLVKAYPQFQDSADQLLHAFDQPDTAANLKLFSNTVKLIENAIINIQEEQVKQREEISAIQQEAPEIHSLESQIKQLKNEIEKKEKFSEEGYVRIKKRELDVQRADLEQIKKAIDANINTEDTNYRTLVLNKTTQQLETEKPPSKLSLTTSFRGEKSKDTKSKDPNEIANFILSKVDESDSVFNDKKLQIVYSLEKNKTLSAAISADQMKKVKTELTPKITTKSKSEAPVDTVKELLDPKGNRKFQQAFLLSYRGDIIGALTGNKEKSVTDSTKLFSFITDTFTKPETTFDQKRQLMSLADQWIRDPFINNGEVAQRKEDIEKLIEAAKNDGSPTLKEMSEKLSLTLNEALAAVQAKVELPNGTLSINETISQIAKGNLEPSDKQAVQRLAATLTAQTIASFSTINSAEFRNAEWGKRREQAPNLLRHLEESTNLSNFVTQSIMKPTQETRDLLGNGTNVSLTEAQQNELQEQSARVLTFFIEVQKELLSANNPVINYDACMAINTGINADGIKKLKKTQARLSGETKGSLDHINEILDSNMNYKNIRQEIQDSIDKQLPFIPFLGMYQTDITMGTENSTTIKDKEKDIINHKKIEVVGNSLSALNDARKNVLLNTSIPNVMYKLDEIDAIKSEYAKIEEEYKDKLKVKKDEAINQLHTDISQAIEPPLSPRQT
jgi:RasGEF domain